MDHNGERREVMGEWEFQWRQDCAGGGKALHKHRGTGRLTNPMVVEAQFGQEGHPKRGAAPDSVMGGGLEVEEVHVGEASQ